MPIRLDDIDACLPQTQCTRCSYPCCLDYAQAILNGEANINQCPPGGDISIAKLASLTGHPTLPLDPEFGEFQPKTLAFIIEDKCIGCVLCIKACPVDAIVGANKLMHSVIQSQCTGCELCLPVCPTDCIEMQALPTSSLSPSLKNADLSDWPGYSSDDVALARQRYQRRDERLKRYQQAKPSISAPLDAAKRQQAILEAVKRRQAKQQPPIKTTIKL